MKRILQLLISASALLTLALVLVLTVSKHDRVYSTFENRNYAEIPSVSLQTILDGSYFSALEDYLIDRAPARTLVLKAKYTLDHDVLHRPVINDIVVTDDVLLPYHDYTSPNEALIDHLANYQGEELGALQAAITSYGGNGLVYLEVPSQTLYYIDAYPWYLEDKADVMSMERARFTAALTAHNIHHIDFAKNPALLADPSLFGATVDHHYSLKAAYLAYQSIIDSFNELGNDALTYTAEDELTFHPYENHYLGSRARPIFDLAPVYDTLYYATFAEEILYERYIGGQPSAVPIFGVPNADEPIGYTTYMGWDVDFDTIKTNRPELPSVLIYGDSYTNAIETFLYRSFDTTYSIDLRHYDEMPLVEFVKEYQPDYVVCVRDTSVVCDPNGNGSVTNSRPNS